VQGISRTSGIDSTATSTSMAKKTTKDQVDLLFDARHIRQTGIGSYISAQLPYLEEALFQRKKSLAVLADEDAVPPVRGSTKVISSPQSAAPMYSIREQKAWSDALDSVRPRAVWLPHYPCPLALFRPRNSEIKLFVTVLDTIHLLERNISGLGFGRRMYARTMLRLDVRRCRQIITPSHATARNLLRVAPTAPVTMAPIPIDSSWFEPVNPTLSPIQGKYILYVGLPKRHKNLPLLINAHAAIASEVPHKLVIAGGGNVASRVDERVELLVGNNAHNIELVGRLDFDALRSLVAGADLLVLPSLHEGAGLPPLEAMACGTAVLASDIPALRETCGDGADYFDPHDPEELAYLMRRYCSDQEARAQLTERGWSHVTRRQSTISFSAAAEAVCSGLE
jgi:glycosyltransferase involved in cell wall biosynthesis